MKHIDKIIIITLFQYIELVYSSEFEGSFLQRGERP